MDNSNNKMINKEEVENILNYFGNIGDNNTPLKINNLENYRRAFVHESYYQSVHNVIKNEESRANMGKIYIDYIPDESSERLEYLGDHVLKGIMGRYLHQRFPLEREGFLTKLKIKIEKCSMLHKIGVTLGFKKYLLLSLQVENQTLLDVDRGRNCQSYYEDSFEAFIGSISVDFDEMGYIYADRFVRNVIENIIDFSELISHNDNFKDALQRYYQQQRLGSFKTPVYSALCDDGPLYRKVFTRMLIFTKEQFEEMDEVKRMKIKTYTNNIMDYYKRCNPNIFNKLFELYEKNNYILGIGLGKKVIQAEQECAKQCMINLELDMNY
jgi:dsRNA-specific ribonuclease